MTLPDHLHLARFRSFAAPVKVPLRPITLVLGANNAGKSALLRALAAFGTFLTPERDGVLRLPAAAFGAIPARDLAWMGRGLLYDWEIGLGWNEGPLAEARFTLDVEGDGPLHLASVEVCLRDGTRVQYRAGDDRTLRDASGRPEPVHGLLPRAGATSAPMRALRDALEPIAGKLLWLHGVRAREAHLQPLSGESPLEPIGRGEGSRSLIATDPTILASAAAFYAALQPRRRLEIERVSRHGTLVNLSPEAANFRVHISNTGEGMTQVLPVLVQAGVTARDGGVLAVEEPESHLHLDAQRTLAEHLSAMAANAQGRVRFVLETHSRVFVLGVQLAVAEGRIRAEDVAVLWVDQEAGGRSILTTVELGQGGQLGAGWPREALRQDLKLAGALTSASAGRS